MLPNNLPDICDGCGAKFSLEHAQSCKFGGLVHLRHDEVGQELMYLSAMALRDSAVRAEPLINPGSLTTLRQNANNDENNNNETEGGGERGDIIVRGLWGNGHKKRDGIIDVRVTDVDSPSHRNRLPEKILESQEKSKKTKYLEPCFQQNRSFTPFVVSSDGLLGREARSLLKQLSLRLADKWQKPYSVVAGIVRSRMSIAIIRASHQCIRGSRIPFRSISRRIAWEDGSGTALYQISN